MENDATDHYAVLGLDRRCTPTQIRNAYRRLARRVHPDLNPDSPDATRHARELNAAHETLSDPARRRAYDRELEQCAEPPPVRAAKIERNIRQDAHLRIEDFLRGAALKVRVNDPANPNGAETYPLEIPPDTAPGAQFRIPRDAPFEGAFVIVRLRPLPGFRFKVRGADLRSDLRISAQRAKQGGSEMLMGATGKPLRVEIPAGVSRGEVLKIPREGMPKPRGGRGDLLLRVTYRPEVRITRGSFR